MMRRLWFGIIVLVVGLWIWLSALNVPYISFARNWPLLIVALGLWVVVRGIRRATRRRRRRIRYIVDDLERGRIDVEAAITEIRGGEDER